MYNSQASTIIVLRNKLASSQTECLSKWLLKAFSITISPILCIDGDEWSLPDNTIELEQSTVGVSATASIAAEQD